MLNGREDRMPSLFRLAGLTAAGAAAAAGGWMAYSRFLVDHHRPLRPALAAERRRLVSRTADTIEYYADDSTPGTPLLLVHSINAAASAKEMRPLFDHFRNHRPVFAPDLPGFGFSERRDRPYTPYIYADAIAELAEAAGRGKPVDVVALSLSCEFAAMAAVARPEFFRSLVLISPTGLDEKPPRGVRNASWLEWTGRRLPIQPYYDLLVTRRSIDYQLKKHFSGPVDPDLAAYAYDTAHQPEARFAPMRFIEGELFSPTIRTDAYEALNIPVHVLYDRDPYVGFAALPEMLTRPNWSATRIPGTWGMPHFDRPRETTATLDEFWKRLQRH